MGLRRFDGSGVGFGLGIGCGFGVGWGFGGAPIGIAGMGAGGGCGVGVGLGWGFGSALGAQYIDMSPEFNEARTHRPGPIQQVKYAVRRLVTLGMPPKDS
mmetsp:Transcript_4671/g.13366  ORF Transcript_4671/g.13366 Transcript_4671/m.13366 type:complete len:100 (+) Transcript_4671:606-905(+)